MTIRRRSRWRTLPADQLPAIRLCAYPIWGWTLPPDQVLPDDLPQGFRLAVERHLPAKRRAIAAHRSQISRMIDDDPDSFMLSAADLARFDQPYETFIRVADEPPAKLHPRALFR